MQTLKRQLDKNIISVFPLWNPTHLTYKVQRSMVNFFCAWYDNYDIQEDKCHICLTLSEKIKEKAPHYKSNFPGVIFYFSPERVFLEYFFMKKKIKINTIEK